MSGWSGVALAGFGAGIGKAMEPENIAKIKSFVESYSWDKEQKDIKDAVAKDFSKLFGSTDNKANNDTTTSSTIVPNSTNNSDINTNYETTAKKEATSIDLSTGVSADNKVKYTSTFKVDDSLLQHEIARRSYDAALKTNNPSIIQTAAAKYDSLNKLNGNLVMQDTVKGILNQDISMVDKGITRFFAMQGQGKPSKFSGEPRFEDRKNVETGQDETFIVYEGGGKVALSDLNSVFSGNIADLTRPDKVGRAVNPDGSVNKKTIVGVPDGKGAFTDTFYAFRQLSQIMFQNEQFEGKDSKNNSALDILNNIIGAVGEMYQTKNFRAVNDLANSTFVVDGGNTPLINAYTNKFDVTGKLSQLSKEEQQSIEPFLESVYVKTKDATTNEDITDERTLINPFAIVRNYKSIVDKLNGDKESRDNYDKRVKEIKDTFLKDNIFPMGDPKDEKGRDKLKNERTDYYKNLIKYVFKTTDFNVENPVMSRMITKSVFDSILSDAEKGLLTNTKVVGRVPFEYNSPAPQPTPGKNPLGFQITRTQNPMLMRLGIGLTSDGRPIIDNDEPRLIETRDDFGKRNDGTDKGSGWIGTFENNKGQAVSEYTIGVRINGKEMDIPTLVPGLNKSEIVSVIRASEDGTKPPESVIKKAIKHATELMNKGESPFAPKGYVIPKTGNKTGIGVSGASNNIPIKNNNPGALKFANQTNAKPNGDFASFPSPKEGWLALKKQIALDGSRNLSLRDFIYKYAPPNENNTKKYIEFVSSKTGSKESDSILDIPIEFLAAVITRIEGDVVGYNHFKSFIPELAKYNFD